MATSLRPPHHHVYTDAELARAEALLHQHGMHIECVPEDLCIDDDNEEFPIDDQLLYEFMRHV